jgi:hypothetical protein
VVKMSDRGKLRVVEHEAKALGSATQVDEVVTFRRL